MAQAKITLLGMFGYFDSLGDDLFKYLNLPEGMSKETFTDTLFLDYGERAVLYTNPSMMQRMIGAWSSKWSLELSRIAKTLLDDYEPLWNIDRYEAVTDSTDDKATESTNGTLAEMEGLKGTLSETEGVHNTLSETEGVTGSVTATNGTTNAQTVENTTSAYNSSQYEPDNKSQVNGSTTESINQSSGSNTSTSQASDSNKTVSQMTGSDKSLSQATTSQKANDYSRDFEHSGHYYGNGGVTSSQALVKEEILLREKYNLYHEACKLFSDDLLLYMY